MRAPAMAFPAGGPTDITMRQLADEFASEEEITLFKSVGTAVEDFAAAKLVVEQAGL